MKKILLSISAVLMLTAMVTPAQAQYHRHRHCWYSHHHRHCTWR